MSVGNVSIKSLTVTKREGKGMFEETFLAEVEELLRSGQLGKLKLEPIQEDEEVIGELTPLELAFFLVFDAHETEINANCDGYHEHDPEKAQTPACLRLLKLKNQQQPLVDLVWALIQDRLGWPDDSNLTIRQGNKIVKTD
jgi:hypothetical protein